MNYLSKMLEIDNVVEAAKIESPQHAIYLADDTRKSKIKELDEIGERISISPLSKEDKDMFLDMVGRYKANLGTGYAKNNPPEGSDALKYLLVALLSGGVGFGLGMYAKGAYEKQKDDRIDRIVGLVKEEMEKKSKTEVEE